MRLQVLVDNPGSWMVPHAHALADALRAHGHEAAAIFDHAAVRAGNDALALLSCEQIAKPELLAKSRHNLVVHASALPKGRGWSPLTYQILEGCNEIPLTLFEAAAAVDAGPVYARSVVRYEGHELIDEMRQCMAQEINAMILAFACAYPAVRAEPQAGEGTVYPRRRPQDARLDAHRTIAEQFNLLRVADNERYPAWFEHLGHRYTLRIEKVSTD